MGGGTEAERGVSAVHGNCRVDTRWRSDNDRAASRAPEPLAGEMGWEQLSWAGLGWWPGGPVNAHFSPVIAKLIANVATGEVRPAGVNTEEEKRTFFINLHS